MHLLMPARSLSLAAMKTPQLQGHSQGGRAQRWDVLLSLAFAILSIVSLQLFFLTGWAVLSFDCFLKVQEGEAESFKPSKNGRICVTLKQTSGSSCLELRIRICSV